MTEQQTVKNQKKKSSGVILNGRFVHRDNVIQNDNWRFIFCSDEIIARLAEYFSLNQAELLSPHGRADDATSTSDVMPRFPESHRDGLHVPKEGKNGTGN